jgi:hypothetical protein
MQRVGHLLRTRARQQAILYEAATAGTVEEGIRAVGGDNMTRINDRPTATPSHAQKGAGPKGRFSPILDRTVSRGDAASR